MEGYESTPDVGDDWQPTKREVRRQREAEDIRRPAKAMAASAPPLPQEVLERVAAIMARPTPQHELMTWRLRLFCGHVVMRTAHASHTTVHSAFTGSTYCPECGLDPATVVAAEAVGLAAESPSARRKSRDAADRDRIERAIARHEREIDRLRRELAAATRAD